MNNDFANYPVSVAEAKADKADDSRLWTPRDALISMLREIDAGEFVPDALIAVYRYRDADGELCSRFINATPDCHVALGLLARGQFKLMVD